MSNQNITRRSVMQGAGAVGLAGIVGGTVVAQEDTETGQPEDESAAVRVVHAVADAPPVTVRLSSDDSMTDDGDGGTVTGDENATEDDGNATGDETVTDADEGEPTLQVSALEYSGVTDYNEVEPGSYQLELVVSNENIVDRIIGIFGDDDSDDETVLYQETVEVEESTTYTAVAFGELSEGPSQTGGVDDGVGMGDEETEDDGIGMDDEETEAGGVDDSGQEMVDRSLRVAVLEDDLSAPEEGMARLRLFHAIPDTPSVSVARTGEGTDGTATDDGMTGTESGDGVGGTETPDGAPATDGGQTETDGTAGSQTVLVEDLAYGETETIEVEAGDYSFQIMPTGSLAGDGLGEDGADDGGAGDDTAGNETGEDGVGDGGVGDTETASQEAVTQQDTSAEVDVTLEDSVATSGFAIGYFDPEAAADERSADGDDGAGVGENDTDGGLGGGENDTEDGLGDDQNDTGDGLGDDQNETEGGDGEQMPQADGIQSRSVELVTVFDSRDGERAAGGNRDLL